MSNVIDLSKEMSYKKKQEVLYNGIEDIINSLFPDFNTNTEKKLDYVVEIMGLINLYLLNLIHSTAVCVFKDKRDRARFLNQTRNAMADTFNKMFQKLQGAGGKATCKN